MNQVDSAALLAALLQSQELLRAGQEHIRQGQELIRAELREVVALLEKRRPAPGAADAALLQAISLEIGDVQFSAKSLVEHAGLQCAQELRAALDMHFGSRLTPKRLGNWLGQMRDRGLIAGRYVVEHSDDGQHRGGIWRVRILRI